MVSAILGAASGGLNVAGSLIKGKQDMKLQDNQNAANLTMAALQQKQQAQQLAAQQQAQAAKQKQQQLYFGLAALLIAFIFLGFVLYLKKRK
ncbi:hypothetical protein Q0590_25165 [Rhodocytophaga aerolata]|uniref:LPXTG cell wall anchor domain-containing protein n=1 Tax=Rhodocytophaga aerolata TaxID=455078 RepID=A0ABT8RFV2_9BACT|nr:hypothetical protein [Rhodocytophaga aerolata]MDO1449592.1 hypothetical protein [Rhodocytophaga aerolata]